MTLKRLILAGLTLIVVFLVGTNLLSSWNEPQISDRLELSQTDLLLHASELQADQTQPNLRTAIVGAEPLKTALEQYQEVRQTAQKNLDKLEKQLADAALEPAGLLPKPTVEKLKPAIVREQAELQDLDLRIGLLQAKQNNGQAAIETWRQVTSPQREAIAAVLSGLWSEPPRLLPDAESQIQASLDGWFRYTALHKLYELQQRSDAIAQLEQAQQETAQQTIGKLALVGTVPVLGVLTGIGLLVFLVVQRVVRGKEAVLALDGGWSVPWNWETIVLVLVVGFFLVGQVFLPLTLQLSGLKFSGFGVRSQAVFSLTFYLLMASSGLLVLYLAVRRWLPLPDGWFQFKFGGRWALWGLGGYFVALPLMIVVSIVNSRIWQGQGGSNPLLQLVLQEGDRISLLIFLFTAAVAAPIFEETLFRGFLLPSLTRYLPVWGAIGLSSLIFAIAHLSLSEVLPLTVLGAVLGFVYTRSRNLLASMLLHSLWNSVTMISLFLLGSGTR
ncbi:CPBP family intramembrane metalloprotease [Microcoleus sp. FACHB-1515]|uniref:CPBP family glutamic-type intramembrane protease n=1 Tax=Cyanophyceae TaxID=3028117 RepID=UPI0016872B22|nr:CPBP family glutamic-type intramembrane protease [Microcoleus sp. FACHB-1515]MBD2089528.1 CPBP family intramembrane metalloprotease [Microcoleus sp. FACHB-1515]